MKNNINYFTPYHSPYADKSLALNKSIPQNNQIGIVRTGLYRLMMEHSLVNENDYLPIEFSKNQYFTHKKFFKLKQLSPPSLETINSVILIATLAPLQIPLFLIENFLDNFLKYNFKPDIKIYIHLQASDSLINEDELNLSYVFNFYKLLQNKLGSNVEIIEDIELIKRSNYKEIAFYELGTQWLCTDNFIRHFLIARNALYLSPSNQYSLSTIEHSFRLSPNHIMELGEINNSDNKLSYSGDQMPFYFL